MRIGPATIILLTFIAQPVFAIPVNHDAPDGIAAVAPHIQINDITSSYAATLILGTDGSIYLLNLDGRIVPYQLPYGLEISWPIEFSQIVDWNPCAAGIPESDDFFVHQGIVLASDGTHWVQCIKVLTRWDSQGPTRVELTWKKIALTRE